MQNLSAVTLPLVFSGLAVNPAVGEITRETSTYRTLYASTLISRIAEVLRERGLDDDAAESLAAQLVDEEESVAFEMLLDRLTVQGIVNEEEVLTFLSQAALHRQKIDFESYDQLLSMVEKIKQKPLEKASRAMLRETLKHSALMAQFLL